jgi:hypothetical protein
LDFKPKIGQEKEVQLRGDFDVNGWILKPSQNEEFLCLILSKSTAYPEDHFEVSQVTASVPLTISNPNFNRQ